MPVDMEQHISVPDVHSDDQFTLPNLAEGQRKGKVRSFLPGFVDRAIFRGKSATYRNTAESPPEVNPATNAEPPATKSHILRRLQAQLDRTETQKLSTANGDLRTSLVTTNKERKIAPQVLDKATHHSRAVQKQLNLDRNAMQSEVSEIIQSYDSKLRHLNELNMRQGAQVIKLQSRLFDQDEHIAHLESLDISNSVEEPDTGSQDRLTEVQVVAERESKPQSTEPAVAVKKNSVTKREPERRRKLIKRHLDTSERRKDDDPFASEPNLAPHRRIRNVLADARDRTLATISELGDARRKKDEQQPSQACHGQQAEFTAFQDIRSLLADARECGARTRATISEMKDARRKKDEQRPSQACHGHQAEFAAYQDQIAALTSERDTLSRELKRSTRMANSNAFLLNSVELQAQRLLSEHDALVLEHQQEKARSQQQIRELETQLEETTTSASRAREHYEAERERLLEVEEQLKLKRLLEVEEQLKFERIQSAQNQGNHLDEMLTLFRENAEQANAIDTLNGDPAEQRTTVRKLHIQPDLANNAQAIMKRKLQKMETASQQAQKNIELFHSTPPKASGSIFGRLSKRSSRNGPRQVLHRGPLPTTQEFVKNEKAQPTLPAPGTSSSPPTSAHKGDGVTSQHAHRMLSCSPTNPPVAKPSPRDLPNDTLDVSIASIFSDGVVDLLLEPSKDVVGEGNGLDTLCSMLSVVRMHAPSPIRGPPEMRPRHRNVDTLKIPVHPDAMAKLDGVAVEQTCKLSSWFLFKCLRSSEVQGRYFIFDSISSSISSFFFSSERSL
ncbi:hypothetical protein EDB19DRAFT_1754158 [Suillus lakei]|nr:hypothetical protein EDB19DRAFT_1754158 [Suillus lakei]